MKKMLLIFLVLIFNAFGAWNTINITDEFGDKTKQVSIYTQNVNKGFIRVCVCCSMVCVCCSMVCVCCSIEKGDGKGRYHQN